ncbi:hypothetical protein [Mycobacterium nebraskense]|uniref:hypothetical protein n=1 Tax=Mycobacterium nebraskense TaxID=244292 RepID=UPI0023F558A8|nr:hypothetical protein [Mycobacterium nebraskense]MBI2693019.1 hypothetical protein [Mycobacterium nebraskense]
MALKLRNDCDYSNYAFIQWAVGVFRSDAGGSTECVVMSNEGFGYIPWGVFLPRSARILPSDTLADNEFRERWFACHDPAEVLVEYAKLRARRGSHLVALAATADSPAGRVPGVEYAVVPPRKMGDQYSKPVLDDLHAHRLQALHPDLYAKLQRLTATATDARLVENKVVVVLAMQMIDAVQMSGVGMPLELRQMWSELGTGDGISEDAWEQYKVASGVYFVNLSANRPKPGAGVTDRERYNGQWVAARAMELLRGWEKRPTAVEDMVYAAAAAYPGDFASKFEFLLRAAEAEMGR